MKVIKLKEDLVIPKGTMFDCCDGQTIQFISGNYETTIGLGRDDVISVRINDEAVKEHPTRFEFVE